jgi:hypothetical protein
MRDTKSRLAFLLLSGLSLAVSAALAGYALTGSLAWGYDVGAIYQPFVNDRPVGGTLTGERIISTNTGTLGLAVSPFFTSAILLLYMALTNRYVSAMKWAAAWLAPALGFPVYAILFVNLLYDGMGIEGAANPVVVAGMAVVLTLTFWIFPEENRPRR